MDTYCTFAGCGQPATCSFTFYRPECACDDSRLGVRRICADHAFEMLGQPVAQGPSTCAACGIRSHVHARPSTFGGV